MLEVRFFDSTDIGLFWRYRLFCSLFTTVPCSLAWTWAFGRAFQFLNGSRDLLSRVLFGVISTLSRVILTIATTLLTTLRPVSL